MNAVSYEHDFYGWIQSQVALLQTRQFEQVDLEHLIEDLQIMGARERRELVNRLCVLLMHLLKWQYEPERRGKSWVNTIREQRRMIPKHLKDNPSLKGVFQELWLEAYDDARKEAALETSLPLQLFPNECLWTFEQVIDHEFWPEAAV